MAYTTTRSVSTIQSILNSISGFFGSVIRAQSRHDSIQAMQNLSDKQLLSQYGITRDQIVSFVFRDKI